MDRETKEGYTALQKRAFRSTTPDAASEKDRSMSRKDWKVLGVVMTIASFVRIWGLDWPASVVFDEVHFGGFAKKYVIGRFFFDVHPPLAKMLFAVFAFLGGFDGDSDFNFQPIGEDYIKWHIPYITMRMLPASTGLATIALCYATLRASGVRTSAAGITASISAFENTFATESRYILLDSPLVCFIALTVYAFKRFENTVPFRRNWFRYLFLTGLSLGATVSSKWVGSFTLAWVGLLTVYQMWFIWGDLRVTVSNFSKQFIVRLVISSGVPFLFYMAMFALHFFCVDNMGDGADLLPRWFQASLKHNNLPTQVPADVAFGSVVSLRHVDSHGGWSHSHVQTYPTGSEQQQITLYGHLDDNNLWQIENGTETWRPENSTGPVFLKDGDIIRLKHLATERRLHSHDHRAPVSQQDYIFEVSGYGFEGFEGDWNDNWRVKIVDSKTASAEGKDHVQALRTYFQLEHTLMGCSSYSKDVRLPDWGFEQQEVSCIRGGKLHNTLWFIESNINSELPEDTPLSDYEKPGFFKKFVESNKAMWNVNKGLTDSHYWESRPSSWIILKRGINMWGEHNRQVYLVGNLPVYWAVLAAVLIFVANKASRLVYWQFTGQSFSYYPSENTPWALFDHHFGNYALGWWVHSFPSFLMVRQLFLHHYLGSSYFGVLMIGQSFELLLSVVKPKQIGRVIMAVFFAAVVAWYLWYSPLIYGTAWSKDLCERSKFFDMDFDCNLFFENRSDYKQQAVELKESRYSAWHGLVAPTQSSASEEIYPENPQHFGEDPEQIILNEEANLEEEAGVEEKYAAPEEEVIPEQRETDLVHHLYQDDAANRQAEPAIQFGQPGEPANATPGGLQSENDDHGVLTESAAESTYSEHEVTAPEEEAMPTPEMH